MIAIIETFEINWPYDAKQFLTFFSTVGMGLSGQGISFKCLAEQYEIDYNGLYVQSFFISLLPFCVIGCAGAYFFLCFLMRKQFQKIRFIISTIVVSIFFQSSVVKILFENIPCKTINGNDYLAKNMAIECNSISHTNWVPK